MTVTYTHEVANARLGGFSSLLLRWKGSVYKLFYKEFIIYIVLYTTVSIVYRNVDNPYFKDYFEKLCLQFRSYTDLIPISFVLGFYVSMVVGRWWSQYENLPWPDRLMILVPASIHGTDNRGRMIRRTLLRYINLSQVLTYRAISTAAFKRFPTIQHIIDAGFMSEAEYKEYENVKTKNVKYWVPCVWFANLLSKIRQEGRIYDDMTYNTIMQEMNNFRSGCGTLFSYDWISIPLVYTQVVTVAVYAFFMSTILGRQYLDTTKNYTGHEVDLYIPIFTIFQFFFYVGWLKVAEQLINPFGEDDDDFEVNWIIDRNFELSMLAADNMYMKHPKLEKDKYWNNPNPSIPYTAAAANHKLDAFLGSAIDMRFDPDNMEFLPSSTQPNLESYETDYNQNIIIPTEPDKYNTKDSDGAQNSKEPIASKRSLPKMITSALAATINRHFMSQNQEENEARRALIKKDFRMTRLDEVSGEANMSGERKIIIKNDEEDKDDMLSPEPDSDDDSELGSVSDTGSRRRSSLSSEEDDIGVDRSRSALFSDQQNTRNENLHEIAEVSALKTGQEPSSNKLGILKPKRPDKLTMNPTNQAKSMHRNIPNQRKKSPKKRANINKFTKSKGNIISTNSCDTDQERRNAQIRTVTMLKNTRKKSLQALQRNARRSAVHYSDGRFKYRYHSSLGIHSPDCNTSMTSGTEDPSKQENDSPFGSMLSFATSIPSPRPLRWCYNRKHGLPHYLESPLMTSNLPSPTANDDYGSTLMVQDGLFGSPRLFVNNAELHHLSTTTTPEVNNTSVVQQMPYTEDLRKRLLVVNPNHVPQSPSKVQTTVTRHVQDISIPATMQDYESDSLKPAHVSSTLAAAKNNCTTEKTDEIKDLTDDAEENRLQPSQKLMDVPVDPERKNCGLNKLSVTRSKSCSDVPISRKESRMKGVNNRNMSAGTNHIAGKPLISDGMSIHISTLVESEVSDSEDGPNPNNDSFVNDSSVHWENECGINKRKNSNPHKDGSDMPSEIEAKLSAECKDKTNERCNANNDIEELSVPEVCFSTLSKTRVTSEAFANESLKTRVTSEAFANESAERCEPDGNSNKQSDTTVMGHNISTKSPSSKNIIYNSYDQGYHSAKEEVEFLLAASVQEPFKIRDSCYNMEIDRGSQMRKIAEVVNVQFQSDNQEKTTDPIEKLITTNEDKYFTQNGLQPAAEGNSTTVSSESSATVLQEKPTQSTNELSDYPCNITAINALV